ncbi:hypothetical protein [Phytohabitans kaempferiae]|uniref:Pilus assembly protein TadE n=1 Tax=Phytohabitans kaempferiae TaxID=1620943 RepID=A0ABV6MAA3_9ACTN
MVPITKPHGRFARARDGGSTAVELAVLAPATIAAGLALVQLLFWGLGGLAAQAAADRAAQATRTAAGSPTAGEAEAASMLDELASQFLSKSAITVTRGVDTTTVAVTATARGLPLPIRVTVEVPTERLTTPGCSDHPLPPSPPTVGS